MVTKMNDYDYLEIYQLITQGFQAPERDYTTPEKQGETIQKCSILETTTIQYSNEIKPL